MASGWGPVQNVPASGTTYTPIQSTSEPTQDPAEGQYWYNTTVDEVDILIHNGTTWTAKSVITNSSDAGNQVNAEAAYVQVEGDFGRIVFGDMDDSAASAMDGALGRNNDIETQGGLADADTAIGIGAAADITYMSPSLSGFQVGFSKDLTDADNDADDGKTDIGVTYSMGGASVYYGTADDDRSFGVKGSMAGFTVAVGNSTNRCSTFH